MTGCPRSELLVRFLEGDLDARERRALEAHLGTCPACRERLEDWRVLEEAASSLPPVEVPPGFAESVMDAVACAEEARRRWLGPIAAAFSTLVVSLLGFFLFTGTSLPGVLVAALRSAGSALGRFVPLAIKMLKVADILRHAVLGLLSALAESLAALTGTVGPARLAFGIGLGALLLLALYLGAKGLVSEGERT